MQRLFELSQDYAELFDRFDSINDYEFEKDENGHFVDDDGMEVDPEAVRAEWLEAWYDTLEMLEADLDVKVENTAVHIKSLVQLAKDQKAEAKKLSERAKTNERKAEMLKKYILDNMKLVGINKIDRPRACVTIRKNPPSVKIENEDKFIDMLQISGRDDLLRYAKPEIRKTDVKKLIQSGEEFQGASLENSISITIK